MSGTSVSPPLAAQAVGSLCRDLGFSLPGAAVEELVIYLGLLEKWNRVMNLVGPGNWRDVLATLVVDSLRLDAFVRALPLPPAPECRDLGAGAGLPGIPLRMLWQEGTYALVEAREKRALFLRTVLASCPLPGVSVFQGRAEAFMAGRGPAHLTVSRAFLPWEKVLALVEDHTATGGFCLFLTLKPLPQALPQGWAAAAEQEYAVGADRRWFWALRKV